MVSGEAAGPKERVVSERDWEQKTGPKIVLHWSDLAGDENPPCSVLVKVTEKREENSEKGNVWEKVIQTREIQHLL